MEGCLIIVKYGIVLLIGYLIGFFMGSFFAMVKKETAKESERYRDHIGLIQMNASMGETIAALKLKLEAKK